MRAPRVAGTSRTFERRLWKEEDGAAYLFQRRRHHRRGDRHPIEPDINIDGSKHGTPATGSGL